MQKNELNSSKPSFHQQLWGRFNEAAHELGRELPTTEQLPWRSLAGDCGVSSQTHLRAAGDILGIRQEDSLNGFLVLPEFIQMFPIAFARKHSTIAVNDSNGRFLVFSNIQQWYLLDVTRRLLGEDIQPIFSNETEVLRLINLAYQTRSGEAKDLINSLDEATIKTDGRFATSEDLLDLEDRPTVIKLVNLILFEAVKAGASDIHFQPTEQQTVVRLRIDGVLFNSVEVPKDMQEEVLSRIKVIGKMNIAEKRLPQDGRSTVQVGDRLIDLRIASLPSGHGERIVIRLLDKSAKLYTLPELGMNQETLTRFQDVIHREHGLILVTGPTGSGKSTTLYGALQEINTLDRNVVTLEDPIEYQIDGISQTQINTQKGLTFATGLRNVLRQDPDIIMVGEIRDEETAVMAIQSALTGHLVFSTLHTNDSASAVSRLLDLGIEPYLLSSSLLAVMAQRLIRQVCPHCQQKRTATDVEKDFFSNLVDECNLSEITSGSGCEHCRQSGYRGRLGVFELLSINDGTRELIQNRSNATAIRKHAIGSGMRLLHEDGYEKILAGKTTPEEVRRISANSAS